MPRRPRSPLFLLALALALCAVPAKAALYLWEVASLTNHVYLYGTVHAGKPDWYPLPRPVEDAFADSKALVVEVDISNPRAMAYIESAVTLAAPDSLRNHVDPVEYERFVKLLPRYGVAESMFAQVKPFMAVSMLVSGEWERMGYEPQYGMDAYLIRKAKAELKPVLELEGAETQGRLMASLTEQENRTLFNGTLEALEMGLTRDQIGGMVKAWQDGNPAELLALARHYDNHVPGARAFEEKFVWSRHAPMLAKIEGILNNSHDPYFIAVGALHLAGDRGLVELLRAKGYLVRQVPAAGLEPHRGERPQPRTSPFSRQATEP